MREEDTIDVKARQEMLRAKGLMGETQPIGFASTQLVTRTETGSIPEGIAVTAPLSPTRTRAPRKDKGTHRAPKPQPGAISQEQANTLRKLIEDANRTREEYAAAQDAAICKQERMAEAEAALSRYVDALAGK